MKIFLVLFGVLGATAAQDGCQCGKYGTKENPAPSCKAIFDQGWSAPPSGVYHITTGQAASQVYCNMEDIPGCDGRGWTTVMKTDGTKSTFGYDSKYWTNKEAYNAEDGGAGDQETKLPTYWTTPFTKLCLGMKTGTATRWISVDYAATSLYSAIADDKFHQFSVGRAKWMSLIPGSALQENCNREGFNNLARRDRSHVRIGIVANEQNDCVSPDSRIGYGGKGWSGNGYTDTVYTGNRAAIDDAKGNKIRYDIQAFGYILVQ